MDALTFSILRRAVRLALDAGFTVERSPVGELPHRARTVVAPARCPYAGWLAPYWAARVEDQHGSAETYSSVEISEEEQTAFKLSASEQRYVHLTDATAPADFTYTRYSVEGFTCERCEERFDSDDARTIRVSAPLRRGGRSGYGEQVWCESCISDHAVSWNDDYYHLDICVTVDNSESVPEHYAQDNYYQDDDGDWYSEPPNSEDEEEEEVERSGAYSYGTNVLGRHSWPGDLKRDALCFGVELEVEPNGQSQRAIVEALGGRDGELEGKARGAYILAEDGSLDSGVEIITVPQTLEAHRTGARIPWHGITKALAGVKAKSGQGTENCGMHVHINRKALSTLTVGKMLVFINSPRMQQLVELIAQRPASRYCQRKDKKFTSGLDHADGSHGDHYEALNAGTEHGTLELRIFKGNTRYSRILKNIEFAHALCIYCRDASMQDVEKPTAFLAWVTKRGAHYPNLTKYLSERSEDGATCA